MCTNRKASYVTNNERQRREMGMYKRQWYAQNITDFFFQQRRMAIT